jgi:DNA-directed RNA polymerase specialized sigma24 family protein
MSDRETRSLRTRGQLSRKSDLALAEVLKKSEEPREVNLALEILQERHQAKIKKFLRQKLPSEWVDDIEQEIWFGFYNYVCVKEIDKGVPNLLGTIARNKRVDAIKRLSAERAIEHDLPDEDYGDAARILETGQTIEEIIQQELDWMREKSLPDVPLQFPPLIDSVLTDCQRVLWVLSEFHDYPPATAAKLLGKTRNNLYAHTFNAKQRITDFVYSEEFQLAQENQKLPQIWQPNVRPEHATVIESFTEQIKPKLTPDEIRPLGLTLQELHDNYVASLVLPRWFNQDGEVDSTPPSFLLTRKPDWETMAHLFERLKRDPEDLPDEFPEQCMIRVNVDDGNLSLRVEPMLQIIPDDPELSVEPDTYLSIHSARAKIAVIFGFYESSLYTPELCARWPFVRPDMGLR